MIVQIVVFLRKTDAQRKKNFAFRSTKIAQKFYEWKPYVRLTQPDSCTVGFIGMVGLRGEHKDSEGGGKYF